MRWDAIKHWTVKLVFMTKKFDSDSLHLLPLWIRLANLGYRHLREGKESCWALHHHTYLCVFTYLMCTMADTRGSHPWWQIKYVDGGGLLCIRGSGSDRSPSLEHGGEWGGVQLKTQYLTDRIMREKNERKNYPLHGADSFVPRKASAFSPYSTGA